MVATNKQPTHPMIIDYITTYTTSRKEKKNKQMNEILGKQRNQKPWKEDLDGFPDGVAVGTNDHGSPDGAIVSELCAGDDV